MTIYAGVEFDDAIEHHGIKGMHWGVRKSTDTSNLNSSSPGIKLGVDGSISVTKGASLQRLVRSNGKSLPLKDITYASLNDYDNARYVKIIGGKGFFGGGRDQILGLKATAPIKGPSVEDATKIVSNLLLTDANFRKSVTIFGTSLNDRPKELEQIRKEPAGKTATAWYKQANTALTFDPTFDPAAPYVQKKIRESFAAKGYNAVRDENDVGSKLAKAPIIIFSPEKSLKVVSTTTITDTLRKANKEKLKAYKSAGDAFIQKQLYS